MISVSACSPVVAISKHFSTTLLEYFSPEAKEVQGPKVAQSLNAA